MKKLKFYLIIALLVVIACAGTFLYAKMRFTSHTINENVDHDSIMDEVTVISGDTIRDGLSDIGELATEEYYFTRVETYDSSKNINGFKVPFTQSRFVYSYDGVVKAGINFADIEVDKDDLKKVITVTLPESKILDCNIDTDTFEVYDEKNSIFNPVTITDFNDSLDEMLKAAQDDAVEKGVLERADTNARLIIRSFIQSSYDVGEYYIDVK